MQRSRNYNWNGKNQEKEVNKNSLAYLNLGCER